MTLLFALAAYAASMIVANLLVAEFGPVVTPINAFLLIGMDLSLRDWLHVRLRAWQMAAVIVGAGLLAYMLNQAAGRIAVASCAAFVLASVADWLAFLTLRGSWMMRANGSNVIGAAVDSVAFPTLAFGLLMPEIVALQFAAKVAGGAAWAWVLSHVRNRADAPGEVK